MVERGESLLLAVPTAAGKTDRLWMVATILSAQCTDERVNMVTPPLFHKYPDAKAFAAADFAELSQMSKLDN